MSSSNIAFFASAKSGLGHLQRVGNIATAMRKSGFTGEMNLFCNADVSGIPDTGMRNFHRIVVTDRERMADAAAAAGATLAVSDMMIVPGIEHVGRRRVLILRETPCERFERLSLPNGSPWDRVIVPNPPRHWLPPEVTRLTHRAVAVGWITRRNAPRDGADTRLGVVLATGGGGTNETRAHLYPVLAQILRSAQKQRPFRVFHALGPRAAGAALPEADEVLNPGSRLDALFRKADLVISTAGYNSVLELAETDTPALLVSIPRSYDDQQARVSKWGPLLGHGLEPGNESAAAEWLAEQVAHPRRRAPVDLGPDGAEKAAEILAWLA